MQAHCRRTRSGALLQRGGLERAPALAQLRRRGGAAGSAPGAAGLAATVVQAAAVAQVRVGADGDLRPEEKNMKVVLCVKVWDAAA